MSCEMTQTLLDGYFDGELDLVHSVEIEQHLQTCLGCAAEYETRQTLRRAIRTGSLYHRAPAALSRRVSRALDEAERSPAAAVFSTRKWLWLSLAACVAVATLLAVFFFPRPSAPRLDSTLAQAVLDSHVRSLMATHLVDVASSSKHTVKPWFSGKLDFAPPVTDLAAQGYPLIGGRLDYLDGRPVAALVYKRRKHLINLFLWPSDETKAPGEAEETRQGYALVHWSQGGMTCWAVSDLNPSDLREFTRLVQNPPVSESERPSAAQ